MNTMQALVKQLREPGLWLDEVPVPEIGINDVLIKVLRTGICGTDVHIYNWDAWAQKTIPVPMVVGHEFVGRDRRDRLERQRFPVGRDRQRRGARGLRPLPQLPGRAPASVQGHQGGRRQSARGVRRIPVAADDQRLAARLGRRQPCPASRATCSRSSIRSATRSTRRLQFDVLGEDVLITGAGPDRHHGRRRGAACRGAASWSITDVNPYRLELAQEDGRDAGRRRAQRVDWPTCRSELGMKEGFDVGLEMSGNPDAFRDMLANMCHGGKIAMLGIPDARDGHRLEHRRLQHAHDQGHLRPRNVRDLVQDDGDAAIGAGYQPGDHASAIRSASLRKGFDGHAVGRVGQGDADLERRLTHATRRGIPSCTRCDPAASRPAQIDEIRAAGLFKAERVITSPQQAHVGVTGLARRC